MKKVLFFLCILSLAEASAGSTPALRPHFTVQLNVQASEAPIESVISDMTHAIKKLDDVDVTTDGTGLWILYLNVSPIMDRKGLQGYAISTVIADQYSSRTLKSLPAEDFKTPEVQQTVQDLAKEQVDLREHLVVTCTTDGLPKAYAQIVNHFNETYLVSVREDIDNYNFNKSGSMRRGF